MTETTIKFRSLILLFALSANSAVAQSGMSQEQTQALIINCPSLYQVLSPNSVAEYERSRQSLETYISSTYFMTHSSPEAFLMDTAGVMSTDELTKLLANNLQNDMKTMPEENKVILDRMLQLCPIIWN